jgi:protein-S-isoprenylcysteine O-methyltransferase Ste14
MSDTSERDPVAARTAGLPDLGARGEGWVVLQLILVAATLGAGALGPAWSGLARIVGLIVGTLSIALGLGLICAGILALRRQLTAFPKPVAGGRLIEGGAFGLVRHPMYGGGLLIGAGWGLATASLASLAATVVLAVFFDLKSRREEAWLVQQFAGYAAYRRRTHRLIPRLYLPSRAASSADNGEAMLLLVMRSRLVPAGVPAGVLATITMDAAMVAAAEVGGRAFDSSRVGPRMIGRWAAYLARGRWRHDDIGSEPAIRGELALGMLTHYATGIVLTQAYLELAGATHRRPSLAAATAYGVATSVLPLLVMFPSMGYGWFGLRSGEAARLNRIMLLGHIAFGLGIGLWAPRFSERRPSS